MRLQSDALPTEPYPVSLAALHSFAHLRMRASPVGTPLETSSIVFYTYLAFMCTPSPRSAARPEMRKQNIEPIKGLRDRNGPTCTLSQNGYSADRESVIALMPPSSPSK